MPFNIYISRVEVDLHEKRELKSSNKSLTWKRQVNDAYAIVYIKRKEREVGFVLVFIIFWKLIF